MVLNTVNSLFRKCEIKSFFMLYFNHLQQLIFLKQESNGKQIGTDISQTTNLKSSVGQQNQTYKHDDDADKLWRVEFFF